MVYHIAGNFRIVQNFAVFEDTLAVAKVEPRIFLVLVMDYWWVWSHQSTSMKLRTTKFSSEGLGGNSANLCTSENFPLYGNKQLLLSTIKYRPDISVTECFSGLFSALASIKCGICDSISHLTRSAYMYLCFSRTQLSMPGNTLPL